MNKKSGYNLEMTNVNSLKAVLDKAISNKKAAANVAQKLPLGSSERSAAVKARDALHNAEIAALEAWQKAKVAAKASKPAAAGGRSRKSRKQSKMPRKTRKN